MLVFGDVLCPCCIYEVRTRKCRSLKGGVMLVFGDCLVS